MTEPLSQNSHPGRLAAYLTELVTRLRLSSSGPTDQSARLVWLTYPIRLEAASRLLVYAGAREQDEQFKPLARVLEQFRALVGKNPGYCPRRLDRPFEMLAGFLELLLKEIDAGGSVMAAGSDSRWESIQAEFVLVDDPAGVMADLARILDGWEEHIRSGTVSLSAAEDLNRGWRGVRRRGDHLFQKPILAACESGEAGLRVHGRQAVCGLLLDSPFQRDELFGKIQAVGSRALVLDGPAEAAELAGRATEGLVLLGDNLEPSRNLERVLSLLSPGHPGGKASCVLVCGSPRGVIDPQRRAVAMGAIGAWAPPHQMEDLRKVLEKATS